MPDDDSLKGLDFATKKEIMQLVCSRMSYEGDMGGSGAAMDPLFWVAHGAVDRLFQRVMFAEVFTDNIYKNQGGPRVRPCPVLPAVFYPHLCIYLCALPAGRGGKCSGHDAEGSKHWLDGLILGDAVNGVSATAFDNTQMIQLLDPRSDSYRDLMDSLYEDSTWDWCEGFDDWLAVDTSSSGGGGKSGGGGGGGSGGGGGGSKGSSNGKQHGRR